MELLQVLDKQQAGKREVAGRYKYRMTEADNPNDPGWESEVRAREEEVGRYEGKILAKEFKERLAYNIGQVKAYSVPQKSFIMHLSCFCGQLQSLWPTFQHPHRCPKD